MLQSRSCKENPNKNFADCSVPQEKSNSEINAELDLDFSDHSTCEEGDGKYRAVDSSNSKGLDHHNKFLNNGASFYVHTYTY